MATDKQAKPPRRKKAPETVRERVEKESAKKSKPKKATRIKAKIHKPLSKLRQVGAKEYHPIKAPDKKGVRVLNKRVRFVPKFLRASWAEFRQVTWPTKSEAANKTLAVFLFAIAFTIFVQVLDLVFSKLVKEVILR